MESLPSILFQVKGDDVGDLEYIEGKVLASNYFQVSGDIDAVNDTIEYVVPNGKTAFMIEAKITMKTNSGAASRSSSGATTVTDKVVADLLIDSSVKSKAQIGTSASAALVVSGGGIGGNGSGVSGGQFCKFNVLGLSLVGDAAKKIEIENVLDNGSAFAEMSGYLVDT